MSTLAPFTAFCPECNAGRTFTLSGVGVRCVVCGCTAARALQHAANHDLETVGELCGEVDRLREKIDRVDAMVRAFGLDHGMHSVRV